MGGFGDFTESRIPGTHRSRDHERLGAKHPCFILENGSGNLYNMRIFKRFPVMLGSRRCMINTTDGVCPISARILIES
jgi:hypothetical protein